MIAYTVRCRNAAGTARDVSVAAPNEDIACAQALRYLENDYPAQGWRAEWALG